MKKALVMLTFIITPRLLIAQDIDLNALAGEEWYGHYLNDKKAGYAVWRLDTDPDGLVRLYNEIVFRFTQSGIRQEMRTYSERLYGEEGELRRIISQVDDASGATRFVAEVEGEELIMHSMVGGVETTARFPKPAETLMDQLHHARLVAGEPEVGRTLTYSFFEPMFKTEVKGESRLTAIEERTLEGITVKVYRVESEEEIPGTRLKSIAYVLEDGRILEDITAGIMKRVLEPKETAMDVDYSTDVIMSNAALVGKPIENPRTRSSLAMLIEGPLEESLLFNDLRQTWTVTPEGHRLDTRLVDLDALPRVTIPVDNPEVAQWLEASTFVQSDDPRLIDKACEVLGDEQDALRAAEKLCNWVSGYVRNTYSARMSNAIEVLENPRGDCTEHSILFVGLARAAGIPAREIAGLVYMSGSNPGFYFHQWAKVWVGEWLDVDPTFNQTGVDVTHIKMAEGDLYEQARLIPLIGRLSVRILEDDENGE